jgi:hypothetical protein
MKTFLSILIFLFCIQSSFSQGNIIQESAREKVIAEKNLKRDFISGKRWKLILYKKGGESVAFRENDFMWFRPGGTYEGALFNNWDSGLWIYEKEEKTLSLNLRSGINRTCTITESTPQSLKLSCGDEEMHLVPDIDIKTDVVVTGMKKEISRTWKIVEHRLNDLKIIPKAVDFIRFHPDGNFEQCLGGFYKIGNWSLDEKAKVITLSLAKNSIWNITRIESGVLHLSRKDGGEQLILK